VIDATTISTAPTTSRAAVYAVRRVRSFMLGG
jgi:hypothetical protein